MNHFFLKQTPAFISHKRINGQASPEAILIKNTLDSNASSFNAFMDVREDYLGPFPKTLREKILASKVFLFIIPANNDISFLIEKDNWVRKEICVALSMNEMNENAIKIIPVAFNRDFCWSNNSLLGEISPITNYSIFYYDTNEKKSPQKLLKAMKCPIQINWGKLIGCLILVSILSYLVWGISQKSDYIYRESSNYMSNMEKETSFNHYLDKEPDYTTEYLSWVYSEISKGNRDLKLMEEFNNCYIKGRCIRMVVLAYLSLTNGDLENEHSPELVNSIVDEIYAKIPKTDMSLFSYTADSDEKRKEKLEKILDISIVILNNKENLRSIDSELIKKQLKDKLMGRLWINN